MKAPDGRTCFVWRSGERQWEGETIRLADVLADELGLYNCAGYFVRIDEKGERVDVNLADFKSLIDGAICRPQLVRNGSGWRCEYATYSFPPPRRPDARTSGPRQAYTEEPDSTILDKLYKELLLERIPRVIS